MRARSLILMLSLLLLLSFLGPARAQGQDQLQVAFVLNPVLETESIFDPGSDGISMLAEVFESQGAQVEVIDLVEAVPASTDVIVLIGPHAPLDIVAVVRLWLHVARGNNLLLTLDPVGYAGVNTEGRTSSFLGLLTNGYGLITSNTFLAEPWFTRESISLLGGSYLRAYADIVPHPIIEPLINYGVPVQLWGARAIRVEPIGINSLAIPLLYTDTAYAETNEDVFNFFSAQSAPLELNLETDIVGRLNVAGIGENTATGSRIVVIGDSELFQNGYGLANEASGSLPLHPGNRIFAERLAAWLLELPEDEWPPLPSGFNWLEIDGDDSDWTQGAFTTDETDTGVDAQYDIRGVRAFRNDAYLYLLVETAAPPADHVRVDLEIGRAIPRQSALTTVSGSIEEIVIWENEATSSVILDAAIGIGNVIEFRVPLRVIDIEEQLTNLCLYDNSDPNSPTQMDCSEQAITVRQVSQQDPSDTRFPEGPLVTVSSAREIVLREGPGVEFPEVTLLAPGRVLVASGRNTLGDWIQVQTASHIGWVAAPLLLGNHEFLNLPVVRGP